MFSRCVSWTGGSGVTVGVLGFFIAILLLLLILAAAALVYVVFTKPKQSKQIGYVHSFVVYIVDDDLILLN